MADVLPGDTKLAQALADDRRRLANSIMRTSFLAIGGISVAVIISAGIIYVTSAGRADSINGAIAHVEKVVFAVLPMVGAWVGTVIAFYFARENFDAAAQNTRAAGGHQRRERDGAGQQDGGGPHAQGRRAQAQVRGSEAFRGCRPRPHHHRERRRPGPWRAARERAQQVHPRGAKPDTPFDPDGATLKDALEDATLKPWLENSVVYVPPSATLAQVRQAMEERSRNRVQGDMPTCRDAFVTATGSPTDKVIGYLSDIDIAKHGAYR